MSQPEMTPLEKAYVLSLAGKEEYFIEKLNALARKGMTGWENILRGLQEQLKTRLASQ